MSTSATSCGASEADGPPASGAASAESGLVDCGVVVSSGGGGGAGRFRITPSSDFAFWPRDSGCPEELPDEELSAM